MSSDVREIDALRRLRLTLCHSADRLADTRYQLQAAAQRLLADIEQGRFNYWQQQLQLAQRRLAAAQEALSRKQIASADAIAPGSTDARHSVQVAQQRLRLCEARLQTCREAARQMRRALDRFMGQLGPLQSTSEQDLPNAIALLDHWLSMLDRYQETLPSGPLTEPPR
jgi:hypothetical protein